MELLELLKNSYYGALIGQSAWGYPIFEVIHLVGIMILVGSVTLVDLRLLGLTQKLPVKMTSGYLLRWTWIGFLLIIFSGVSLFISDGAQFLRNPVFITKICLLSVAGLNAALFHLRVYSGVAEWDINVTPPLSAKCFAAMSMVLWICVVGLGRLIAYPNFFQ